MGKKKKKKRNGKSKTKKNHVADLFKIISYDTRDINFLSKQIIIAHSTTHSGLNPVL